MKPCILSKSKADSLLAESTFIASIRHNSGDYRLFISAHGIPVLVFDSAVDLASIQLPKFYEIDSLCSEQSFRRDGQASLITDVLVRAGFCTYRTGGDMRARIKNNLKNRIFIAVFPR